MSNIQEINRQKLFSGIKIFIVLLGCAFLYFQCQNSIEDLMEIDLFYNIDAWGRLFIVLIVFTSLNWAGEVMKWKTLVGHISFIEATKQVIISHGISIFTPNKFGEYGGKCMFYHKNESHKIIAYTSIGHICQLTATLCFGIVGVLNIPNISILDVNLKNLFWVVGIGLLLFGLMSKIRYCRFHVSKLYSLMRTIPKPTLSKTLIWSVFRYLVFSHQFLILLWIFGADLSYSISMFIIFSIYLISSVIPSFALSDGLIKGSISVTIFSLMGIAAEPVLITIFFMWLANAMLPALLGYIWLLPYKPVFLPTKS
jgi:hypothetical protein